MKKNAALFVVFLTVSSIFFLNTSCQNKAGNVDSTASNVNTQGSVKQITTKEFQTKIFDFKTQKEWKFTGTRPCIVDFYAVWCGPCKRVAPIMEELAVKYKDKIDFYKVDVDNEKELAGTFGISSIPDVLLIPATGKPEMTSGAYSKEEYIAMIEKILLTQKK